MNEVGKIQLAVLRIFYFLTGMSFGVLASFNFFMGDSHIDDLLSIKKAVFYAFAALLLAGILQPLKMLPLLLLSSAWKLIWLLAFVLPMYLGGGLDDLTKNILLPASIGLVVTLIAIPWKYTSKNYFTFKMNG